MALIINPRNKQQEKVVMAFLSSLNIGFHSEDDEDAALVNAVQKGRKTALLTKTEKTDFLKQIKPSKSGNIIRLVEKLKKPDVNTDLKKTVF